jgi:AFG3 family protein
MPNLAKTSVCLIRNSNGPQYTFTDASYESLKKSVANAQKDVPDDQKVIMQYEQGP